MFPSIVETRKKIRIYGRRIEGLQNLLEAPKGNLLSISHFPLSGEFLGTFFPSSSFIY
jgi:hypothetical protein